MDLRLLLEEVLAPGDVFLLSWRSYVPTHPSQLCRLQFGLLGEVCAGVEKLSFAKVTKSKTSSKPVKNHCWPLLVIFWSCGCTVSCRGWVWGAEGGGWLWQPWLSGSRKGKVQLVLCHDVCLSVGSSLKASES